MKILLAVSHILQISQIVHFEIDFLDLNCEKR